MREMASLVSEVIAERKQSIDTASLSTSHAFAPFSFTQSNTPFFFGFRYVDAESFGDESDESDERRETYDLGGIKEPTKIFVCASTREWGEHFARNSRTITIPIPNA